MKYRKKPIVIEAMQYTGGNGSDIYIWVDPDGDAYSLPPDWWLKKDDAGVSIIMVRTVEGDVAVQPGDWILKNAAGCFHPCTDDIFQQIYEAVT